MESSYILENFKNRSSQNNLVQKHFFLADSNWIEQISEIPYGRALFGRRTIWGEPFFCEEHFEESTIGAQSTLRRTLLERRAVRGDHQLIRELFLESTFCADSTLWGALFERRAVGGKHQMCGEHFWESTISAQSTLKRAQFFR